MCMTTAIDAASNVNNCGNAVQNDSNQKGSMTIEPGEELQTQKCVASIINRPPQESFSLPESFAPANRPGGSLPVRAVLIAVVGDPTTGQRHIGLRTTQLGADAGKGRRGVRADRLNRGETNHDNQGEHDGVFHRRRAIFRCQKPFHAFDETIHGVIPGNREMPSLWHGSLNGPSVGGAPRLKDQHVRTVQMPTATRATAITNRPASC
jgi:hypothetical protein